MEIKLNRIGYNPRLGINAFAANLMVDGKKAAIVSNKGEGTEYYPVNEEGASLVESAEKYMKTLPKESKTIDGKEQQVAQTLAGKIDKLFAQYLAEIENKKFDKKVELMQKQNIVYGQHNKYMRTHSMKTPIKMLLTGRGKDLLIDALSKKILPEMSHEERILSTNIPADILKAAGFKELQQAATANIEKKVAKKKPGQKLR